MRVKFECRMRWLLLLIVAVVILPIKAQTTVQFSDVDLDAGQRAASADLLDEALRRLPPRWQQALPAHLQLQWRDDLPAHVHGRTHGHRIRLRRELLDGWMARNPRRPVQQGSAAHVGLTALLHELAHVLDRSPQGGLSRDPRLLDLAGWQQRPLRFGLRSRKNPFTDRSPDRYERHSPAEFVAVNLEWFLLDPEYACRRPALAGYFAMHFEWSPASATCAVGLPFLQADSTQTSNGFEVIDPARVYAVDYLLAEANAAPMSRWGHSMLREVICAPGRTLGPDCLLDLQEHRVLSFRAFVDDVQLSSWRGLTGSYPSRLFLLPLDQVINEYTKMELRGLRSVPLRLSQAEITTLLTRAAQLHWSYDSRYYFISNNCAVETWRLLQDGVPRLAGLPLRSITPTGLLRKLERKGVADASVLADIDAAQRHGYYFASLRPRYQQMFARAKQALALPQQTLDAWLASPPSMRVPWFQKADLPTTAALLLLEEAALQRAELLARDTIKRHLLKHDGDARTQMQKLLAEEALLRRPATFDVSGYGLPQSERAQLEAIAKTHLQRMSEQRARLHAQARAALPSRQQQVLNAIADNLNKLGARLRQLNREQGGLELR